VVLGAIALVTLAAAMGKPMPKADRKLWAYLLPIGVLTTAMPFTLLSWGQSFVPSAFAGVSMAAVPLFVLPLAHFFADERLTTRKVIGFSLGFVGTIILLGDQITAGDPLILPRLACIAAAMCYACASVLTRRCPPIDPITLAATTLVVGSVPLVILMLLTEGLPQWQPGIPGISIIALGLVPTALAALLRVSVIRSAGSGFMTMTGYQVPVWSMIFGALVLGEALPLRFFAALGLILAGLVISQRKRQPSA
jgi:drug/metabolite transporter (DMT)-like permease